MLDTRLPRPLCVRDVLLLAFQTHNAERTHKHQKQHIIRAIHMHVFVCMCAFTSRCEYYNTFMLVCTHTRMYAWICTCEVKCNGVTFKWLLEVAAKC